MALKEIGVAAALGALLLAAGCTDSQAVNAGTGALIGAGVGSLVGGGSGKTAALVGGAAVGGIVGAKQPHTN